MPQLIAMVLVVVGALVYMFQTFGGTGNNIEGMAQKTSVITEINNIKSGLAVGLRSRDITVKVTNGEVEVSTVNNDGNTTKLKDLAAKEYFTTQINEQLLTTGTDNNVTYKMISFGGTEDPAAEMALDYRKYADYKVPGIQVNLNTDVLEETKGFIESQIAKDLGNIAFVDRDNNDTDGKFTVYFKDLQQRVIEK